jgi:hypothetical protein
MLLVSVNLASLSTAIIKWRQTRGSSNQQVRLTDIFRDFFSGGMQFSTLAVTPTTLTLAFLVRHLLEKFSDWLNKIQYIHNINQRNVHFLHQYFNFLMSSKCFEPEGPSSGRRFYTFIHCVRTQSSTYKTAHTYACKTYHIITVYKPSSWRWILRFETCRTHKKI